MLAALQEHEEDAADSCADNVKPPALTPVNQPVVSPHSSVATEQDKSILSSTGAEQTSEVTPATSNSSTEDRVSIAVSANKNLKDFYFYE